MSIQTPVTDIFGIKHPIMLAGMNVAAGPKLAAAVTNAGGLGVIGGVGYTPKMLKKNIDLLKKHLDDKNAPFGVDLLLPKIGGGARKTNKDYTEGRLPELVDIIIASGAKLFVSAVGVPPKWLVDKMHANNILVMNMIGAPKHVKYCLEVGVDLICAQGGEGGGHTGSIPSNILLPKVVDLCKNAKSPLTGGPVHVIAAGGIYDGRGLAMSLCAGAQAVWVGTRFVATKEAGAPKRHKDSVVSAGYNDTMKTLIYTGRPLHIRRNWYAELWENERMAEMKEVTAKGVLPYEHDLKEMQKNPNSEPFSKVDGKMKVEAMPLLMGQVAGAIDSVLPAKQVVEDMVKDAAVILKQSALLVHSKL